MKLTTERKPGSIVEFHIEAEDADFQKAVDDAITRQSRSVQIPGFRKGKAPRSMVERFYGGREVFQQDAAEKLMDTYYQEALQQEDVRVVGDPELTDMSFDPTLTFTVSVAVYPDVNVGDYSVIRHDPIEAGVTDDDVEEVVNRLRNQQSTWKDVEGRKPTEGDQVTIDYTVNHEGTEFQAPVTDAVWVLGETNLLQQLRDHIEDLNVGESDAFDVVFEDDDETADPTIRGKQLSYNVTLKGLKERELVDLDDDFAMKANNAENMDVLRQQIRDDIHQGKTGEARSQYLNELIEKIAEVTEIDIPATMVDEEIEHQLSHRKEDLQRQGMSWEMMLQMSNMDEDKVKEDTRPEAERRLRNTMILQEIASREGVEIQDSDLDEEINRLVGGDLNPDESDEEAVDRAKRMRDVYSSDYFRNMLRNDLFERRLTDRLIEIGTEGRGAVVNGWVEPETVETTATAVTDEAPAAASTSEETDTTTASADTAAADSETTASTAATSDEDDAEDSTPMKRSSKLPGEGEGTDWVSGDGGTTAPEGFPIKGNASSKIYHPEESPNYEKTIAEIYFATADAAEAHGYRAPKALQKAGESVADALSDDDK